jgi:hypothetical protein
MWRLWVMCALLAATLAKEHRCPNKCLCFKTTVRCMFLHLDQVPQVPHNTTTL